MYLFWFDIFKALHIPNDFKSYRKINTNVAKKQKTYTDQSNLDGDTDWNTVI